jgi:hypothetical protein
VVLAIVAGAFASLPSAAGAASKVVYPKWTISPSDLTAQSLRGTVKFGVKGLPNATYTVRKAEKDEEEVGLETANESEKWLSVKTPFGAVFGASGPSSTKQMLNTHEDFSSEKNSVTTKITFSSPFPANRLGIAVVDLDVDQVVIRATGANGKPISGRTLQGSARKVPFNFCAYSGPKPPSCDSDRNVPRWFPGSNGGTVKGDGDSSDGSSAWFRPNTKIKSLTLVFTGEKGSGVSSHSYGLWLAALKPTPKRPAYTG